VTDSRFDARWQELVKLTEQEFWNGGQNPAGGVFDPKRAGLNLRGILSDDSYFSVELTEEHVLTGDLARMAQEFHTAYCAAWDLR